MQYIMQFKKSIATVALGLGFSAFAQAEFVGDFGTLAAGNIYEAQVMLLSDTSSLIDGSITLTRQAWERTLGSYVEDEVNITLGELVEFS